MGSGAYGPSGVQGQSPLVGEANDCVRLNVEHPIIAFFSVAPLHGGPSDTMRDLLLLRGAAIRVFLPGIVECSSKDLLCMHWQVHANR